MIWARDFSFSYTLSFIIFLRLFRFVRDEFYRSSALEECHNFTHSHRNSLVLSLSYIQLISNIYLNVRNTCSAWPAAGTTTKLAKKAQAHSDPTHNVFESEANRNKQQQKKKMQKWCGMYLLVCSLASHTVIVSNVERRWKSFYKFFFKWINSM